MKPATAEITPDADGGLQVAIIIPTYRGNARFAFTAERTGSGDWAVTVPWTTRLVDEDVIIPDETGKEFVFTNGITYLGAPDADADEEEGEHA